VLAKLTYGREWLALFAALYLGCQTAQGPAGDSAAPRSSLPLAPGAGSVIAVGAWGRATHYEMRISAPEECASPGEALGELTRLGVDVTVQARGSLQVPANPYYALLIDSTNSVHEATLGGCEPQLSPTLLEPGQTARGWISFDIPRKSTGLRLAYAPALTALPRGELPQVELSREELVFGLGQ